MNLLELLHGSVTAYPNKECLRYKKEGQYHSITYKEFWDAINEFAVGLRECGVKAGDKVGILSANCPQWAISDYAIMSIGAVVVPIYHTLPASQVEFILHNADVSCVLVQDALQFQKLNADWAQHLHLVVQFENENADKNDRVLSFSEVCAIGSQQKGGGSPPDIHAISPDQIATIVHTSGTSGTPKGVMLSHSNIVSNIKSSLSFLPVQPSDIGLSYLPLSHIFERTVGQFAVLSSGAAIAYAESIEAIQQNLQEVKPTVFCTVPRLLEKVYAKIRQQVERLPRAVRNSRLIGWLIQRKLRKGLGGRIKFIVSGGAGLAADIASFFTKAGLPVYEGYGMTEASPVICANPWRQARPGTVGKPIPGVELSIDADGELLVRGPNVMQGYYKAPAETAKTITPEGWLRTGDIVKIEEGYVKIVERKKNIMVLATGKNVAPWPIENSITLSPYIAEAMLVGDQRTFVACLLVPDFAALQPIAEKNQLPDDRSAWLQNPEIRALLRDEVVRATKDFASFERPKRAILLTNEFSMEAGELTPTLKVRNKIILEKYGQQIEQMYNGSDYFPIFDEPRNPDKTDTFSANETEQAGDVQPTKRRPVWFYAAAGVILGIAVRFWIGG